MYRLVALLFALLLPLQFAWGAAAAYCQHEATIQTSQTSWHFGHHEHVHKNGSKKSADTKLLIDNDCQSCHAACVAAVSDIVDSPATPVAMRRLVFHAAASPDSAFARAPDRPQWFRSE
ncbi:MAG: cation efflux protein, CzcI family [Rubrivivax sp.]